VIAAEGALLARAPWLLANSQAIIDEIAGVYAQDVTARATIVPHGTSDPLVTRAHDAAARDAQALTGAPLRVAFVGRFELRKGFDLAARVAHGLIEDSQGDIEFWFAGGALDDDARATLADVGATAIVDHPRVRFMGQLDRVALDDCYVAADVVLMPSRFESFGLVAIEAMAAGRPVLALNAGGMGEIARDQYGARAFTDGPDDAATARAIVAEIETLDADRIELRNRGQLARAAWHDHYSIEAMTSGLEAFYSKVTGLPDLAEYLPSPDIARERAQA